MSRGVAGIVAERAMRRLEARCSSQFGRTAERERLSRMGLMPRAERARKTPSPQHRGRTLTITRGVGQCGERDRAYSQRLPNLHLRAAAADRFDEANAVSRLHL